MLKILNVTSEVVPFSKTGGLADVSRSLPDALASQGNTVWTVTPLYRSVDRAAHGVTFTGRLLEVMLGGRVIEFGVFSAVTPAGVTVYLLENHDLFSRDEIYGTRDGAYQDNHLRFAFFGAAVFELIGAFNLDVDVIHCHDWQAGLVPLFNRIRYGNRFRTVMTVHNMGYQGVFPGYVTPELGIPWEVYTAEGVEFWGQVSFLKAGLFFSDSATTVSPTYAREVLTPETGYGMDGILRLLGPRFSGILNGVDYTQWSPEVDSMIPAMFSREDMSGKEENRLALLREFGLRDSGGPLFGVVGRLAHQKGYDLLAGVMPVIVNNGGMVVVLGTGEREIENMIAGTASGFPERVSVKLAYSEKLAHLIEAGSDFFMMPSRYEPCGLNQMYSLRYGTIPIVHDVGGLSDTVVDVDADPVAGTGLKFSPFDHHAFSDAVQRACVLFRDMSRMQAVRDRGMAQDFSWSNSAARYAELYHRLVQ